MVHVVTNLMDVHILFDAVFSLLFCNALELALFHDHWFEMDIACTYVQHVCAISSLVIIS